MAKPKEAPVRGPEGDQFTKAVNDEINGLAHGTFATPAGQRFMQYLESITTRRVLGPDAPDSHLRHLEGARWLVGVIRQRIAAGKQH
jgi:hypothetical protein